MHKCGKIRRIAKWCMGRTSLVLILILKTISLVLPSWRLVETRACVCCNCKGKYERLIKIMTSITDRSLSFVYILKNLPFLCITRMCILYPRKDVSCWLTVLCNEAQLSSSFPQRNKWTLPGSALLTRTAPPPAQKPPLVELKQIYGKN